MSEFWRLTATETARRVAGGDVSAVEVAEAALSRLDAVNPNLNAVVQEMPEEAMAAARAIDAARAAGLPLGPLAGVPVTVKVNVDQKDHATTNGLRRQRDLLAEEDNPVVSNLRRAGAVIIGRTNTPAFSLRWFCRNSLHGQTLNPWDPGLTPGGSSGGAAAATAAGIGAIGHGTDIGGSIRYPAYACGIHGLRPTLGRVPAANFSGADRHVGGQLMAVSGPLARSIADLDLALTALSAPDQRDPWWVPAPLAGPEAPRRVALCTNPEGLETAPEIIAALHDAAQRLREAGWQVTETESPPFREPARLQAQLWLAETRRSGSHAIAKEDDPDSSFVYAQMEALSPEPSRDDLLDALQARLTLLRQWQRFFENYPLLLCPISAEAPFANNDDVSSPERFAEIMEAQLTQIGLPLMGLPGLAVATELRGRTPLGVQLLAGRYREDLLLAAGRDIEARGTPETPIDPRS
ncbi:MAG: amidase family protein [Pseudomonadota bacterium]